MGKSDMSRVQLRSDWMKTQGNIIIRMKDEDQTGKSGKLA